MVSDLWLEDFDPFCVFLCFKVRLLVIVIIIDGSQKRCDHIETTTNSNAVNSNTEKRLLFYWQVDKVDVKLERKIQLKDLNYMRREMY